MTNFEIRLKPQAIKALEKINEPYYSKIKTAILNLSENPKPHGYIKLKNREGYRIRVSNYRIIYDVFENELIIEIINLGHRKDIYNN